MSQAPITYPITPETLNKDSWQRRVSSTLMLSYPTQQQTIPTLLELTELITRLTTFPIEQTLAPDTQQWFFTNVFPPVCQKLIASKYFRSEQVLVLSNGILEGCVEMYRKFRDIVWQNGKFAELIVIVFDPDTAYFLSNNQLESRNYVMQPWQYFATGKLQNPFVDSLLPGDTLDAIKYQPSIKKASWSRAQLVQRIDNLLELRFLNDVRDYSRNISPSSVEIAPFATRSLDFEWRMQLQNGDLVDCCDSYGTWYTGTVVRVREAHNGGKVVRVGFRVYSQSGEKYDSKGKYNGLAETFDEDNIDVTSPRIQKPGTIAKPKQYTLGKYQYQSFTDHNDLQFQSINGQRIVYVPRQKFRSGFLFRVVRNFIKGGGYSQLISMLETENNWDALVAIVSSLGNISANLHRTYAEEMFKILKPIVHRHLVDESENNMKRFSRDKEEFVFKGMSALMKRNHTAEEVKEYQAEQKLQFTVRCFNSQTLKRRIQGMGELKDLIRSFKYSSSRIPIFVEWLRANNIFQKVYINNTHTQMIKRSTELFRFLVLDGGLQLQQLSSMFKAAQKGDYQTKLTYYKLFQQVSHHLKKQHTTFLIDSILQTQINLVTCQDLDLLYELSRYSNYFPVEKITPFMERILMSSKASEQLKQTCLKKYTDIANRGNRRGTVERWVQEGLRDGEGHPEVVMSILRNIIDYAGSSEYFRYDLLDVLHSNRLDRIVLQTIRRVKGQQPLAQYLALAKKLLEFLSWTVSLSTKRVRIGIDTFVELWNQMVKNSKNSDQRELFYNWSTEVCSGDQVSELQESDKDYYQQFFLKLTSEEQLGQLNAKGFQVIKYLFFNINRRDNSISLITVLRNSKECNACRVKTDLTKLKFYDKIMNLIYSTNNPQLVSHALDLLTTLYTSQDLTTEKRLAYFQQTLSDFFKFFKNGEMQNVSRNITILECIIDESEKEGSGELRSLATMMKGEPLTLLIDNGTVYLAESMRVTEMRTNSNITLLDFRKKLSKQLALPWQEIRVTQKDELPDLYNSKILKDLKIKINQPLVITKRPTYLIPVQPLLIDRTINPKAALALGKVFRRQRFSTNGRMTREQCRQFIGECIGDTTKLYQDKLNSIFREYDVNKDGYIVLENIIHFFESAAVDKGQTVLSNMKHLGIRNDFTCYDDEEQEISTEDLPRYYLSVNQEFYDSLFRLLDCEERVARVTWKLLERLPISKTLYEAILTIKANTDDKWHMLDLNYPYKMLYSLYVFEYLADSQESQLHEAQRAWKQNFIKAQGYEYLFQLFRKLNSKPTLKTIQKNIVQFILKMLNQYLACCFCESDTGYSYSILSSQLDFTSLLTFLSTKQIPKTASHESTVEYTKLLHPKVVVKSSEWKGVEKNEIVKELIQFIEKISADTNDIQRVSELEHCFEIMVCLLAGRDPKLLLEELAVLLGRQLSNLTEQRIFKLLIALCEACPKESPIPKKIVQWLFGISSKSQNYFKTLILLVKFYGIPDSLHESPQRLLNSILETDNQHVIEGCSKLLTQMKLNYEWVDESLLKKIWERCLFGNAITCKSSNARECVYDLLIRIAQSRAQLTSCLVKLTTETLQPAITKSKIVSANDLQNRSVFGYAGLKNIGNICYMLAMLQQFYHNPTFRNLILRIDDHKPTHLDTFQGKTYDDNLLHQLRRMFAYLLETQRMDFAPYEFCLAFKGFEGKPVDIKIQQDAQEFVSMVIDQLEKCVKDTPFKTIFENIYGGKTTNMLTCDKCQKVKTREETFYSLSLEVKNSKNLAESFNKFILGEVINDYRCDFCKQKSDVNRKTAISKCPNILIIHLQRIIFNLDTLINQKINSKFQFPKQFSLSPYTVRSVSKQPTQGQPQNSDYQLTGVIAHYGTAQFGHYYSFIKTQQQQWLEFNDSKVSGFDFKNLESECFGGQAPPANDFFDEEFDLGKKENSKSAYMLVYERKKKGPVQLQFNSEVEMKQVMGGLGLKAGKVVGVEEQKKVEKSSGKGSDDEEFQLEEPVETIYRKLSKDIKEIEVDKPELPKDADQVKQLKDKPSEPPAQEPKPAAPVITVDLQQPISPYQPSQYTLQITSDNLLHEFQVNVCASSFLKFYNDLLKLQIPSSLCSQILDLTQKLTFGVWLKNPLIRQIMLSLQNAIAKNPLAALPLLLDEGIQNQLLENSDQEMRACIALLLAGCVGGIVKAEGLKLTGEGDLDQKVVEFLDKMFAELPNNVAKNWLKFSQYFEFWKVFAEQTEACYDYLMRKETISHFIDFQLEKKSPLQIYANKKHVIGNRFTPPNFSALTDVVCLLINKTVNTYPQRLSTNDKMILSDYSFLEKLLSNNNEQMTNKIILAICPNSLPCSQKVAIVLIKGFHRCSYQTIQPYLQIACSFLTIKDAYQQYRMRWVLGYPTLCLSTSQKSLTVSSSYDQRLYNFHSTIQYDLTCSILQPLYRTHSQAQNSCALNLKSLLTLCISDPVIFKYVYELPAPSLAHGHYYDFFNEFANGFYEDAKRYSYGGFKREELAKMVLELLEKFNAMVLEQRAKDLEMEKEQIGKYQNKEIEKENKEEIEAKQKGDVQQEDNLLDKDQKDQQEKEVTSNQAVIDVHEQSKTQQQLQQQPAWFYGSSQQQKLQQQSKSNNKPQQSKSTTNNIPAAAAPTTSGQYEHWLKGTGHVDNQDNTSTQNNMQPATDAYDEQWQNDQFFEDGQMFNMGFKQEEVKGNNNKEDEKLFEAQRGRAKVSTDKVVQGVYLTPVFYEHGAVVKDGQGQQEGENKQTTINIISAFEVAHQEPASPSKNSQNQQPTAQVPNSQLIKIPYEFKYNPMYTQKIKGVSLTQHSSELTFIRLKAQGKKASLFGSSLRKFKERVPAEALKKAWKQTVSGILAYNTTREYMRLKWKYGTVYLRPSESAWVWSDEIERVWVTDRELEWPRWTLYE